MSARFNPPPGWPAPPPGWEPEPTWLPDASWPPAPPGWQFWVSTADDALPLPDQLRYQPWIPPEPGALRAGSVTKAEMFGWGGLACMTVGGALSSGFSGALVFTGLYALVVGVVAIARGRVGWARMPSRGVGGAVAAGALVVLAVGSVIAPPTTPVHDDTLVAATSAPPVTTSTTRPTATPTSDAVELALASAGSGTALRALAQLTVTDDNATTGYTAAKFGKAWADIDGNGCDQRNDVLRRDLIKKTLKPGGCVVVTGTLLDPYSEATAKITAKSKDAVTIDHVVSLRDAWGKGARDWTAAQRNRFANDPENLSATTPSSLDAKAQDDAGSWLPASSSVCEYVARQISVKQRYGLSVSLSERSAMVEALSSCADRSLPAAQKINLGGAPIVKTPKPQATHTTIAVAKPKPKPTHTTSRKSGVTPGAFCSPEGALGTSKTGKSYKCMSKNGDQARWRPVA